MAPVQEWGESLVLKNKAPRWHEQLQCWCLNFRGRVTVASVKNFQLVADVDPALDVSVEEKEDNIAVWENRKGHLHDGLSLPALHFPSLCYLLKQL